VHYAAETITVKRKTAQSVASIFRFTMLVVCRTPKQNNPKGLFPLKKKVDLNEAPTVINSLTRLRDAFS
jgi:hypothetical protein